VEYMGDGKGGIVTNGFAVELSSPIKQKNSDYVVGLSWEQSQRVHKVPMSEVYYSEGYSNTGIQVMAFSQLGSKGGMLNKNGGTLKSGITKDCSCFSGSLGVMFILGIEGTFNIGFKSN